MNKILELLTCELNQLWWWLSNDSNHRNGGGGSACGMTGNVKLVNWWQMNIMELRLASCSLWTEFPSWSLLREWSELVILSTNSYTKWSYPHRNQARYIAMPPGRYSSLFSWDHSHCCVLDDAVIVHILSPKCGNATISQEYAESVFIPSTLKWLQRN